MILYAQAVVFAYNMTERKDNAKNRFGPIYSEHYYGSDIFCDWKVYCHPNGRCGKVGDLRCSNCFLCSLVGLIPAQKKKKITISSIYSELSCSGRAGIGDLSIRIGKGLSADSIEFRHLLGCQ